MSFGQHGALACICIGEGVELVSSFDSFLAKVESKKVMEKKKGCGVAYLNMQWWWH